jgi:pimeloyl-ACP methyl ester carboxylesterase
VTGRRRGVWLRVRRVLLSLLAVLAVCLVVLVVLALVPVGTDGLEPEPFPRVTPAASASKLRYIRAGEGGVRPSCRTRLIRPSRPSGRVVVLLHGLAGCPAQMAALGRQLADGGATVVLARAPAHGRAGRGTAALADLDAEALADWADDAIDVAAGLGDDVTVVGVSLGGTLAAWAAQEREGVDRAVVIAPALELPGVPTIVADGFTNLFARLPNVSLPADGARVPNAYPPGLETRPRAELYRLGRQVLDHARAAPPVAGQLAVVVNESDGASTGAVDDLVRAWRAHGRPVTVVRLPKRLGLPDDVVDPAQPAARVDVVDPIVRALAEGRTAPSP